MSGEGWEAVWARRAVEEDGTRSLLARLMAADGLDTAYGAVGEAAWTAFVLGVGDRLGLGPGDSVFEVGCGAGAFLLDLERRGLQVAGADRSAALVAAAALALPSGRFHVAEATAFQAPAEGYDAVVSCGVFLYFPDLDYADRVIARMCAASRGTVALLDLPDAALAAQTLAARQAAVGGPEAYAARYAGLDHLAYDREWVRERLSAHGLVDVEVRAQAVDGYENGRWRFNAFGRRPGA